MVLVESLLELELDPQPEPVLDPCVLVPSLPAVPDFLWCLLFAFELFECLDLLWLVLSIELLEPWPEPEPHVEPDVVPEVEPDPCVPMLPVPRLLLPLPVPYPVLPEDLSDDPWFIPELLPERLFLSEPVPLLLLGYRLVESCHMPLPCRPVVS